jgi:hypothetical protein
VNPLGEFLIAEVGLFAENAASQAYRPPTSEVSPTIIRC